MATIGYTGIAANSATSVGNWACEAQVGASYRYTASSGDVVSEVAMYSGSGGTIEIAIYVYSGGVPTTMVGSPVTVDCSGSTGWKTQSCSINLTAGVTYVVAIDYHDDVTDTPMRYENIGGTQMMSMATPDHQNLRSPWANGGTSDAVVSFYATVGSPTITLAVANCSHTNVAGEPVVALDGVVTPANAIHLHTSTGLNVGPTLFTDNFNRANTTSGSANALGADWNVGSNSWYINSNQARKVSGDHYCRYVASMPSVDHFIEVELDKSHLNDYMWMHIRAANNTPGTTVPLSSYEGGVRTTGSAGPEQCEVGRVNADGSYVVLGRGTTVFASGAATYKQRLQAIGNVIEFYIDDVLMISVTDSALSGSFVGLNCYTGDGSATYDNFRAGLATAPPIDLAVNNCAHLHTVTQPVVTLPGVITVDSPIHLHVASQPALTRAFTGRYPATVSGRKWLDQTGAVYLMRTFSSWSMAQNLTNAEITEALEGLAAQNFNSATVSIGGGIDFGGWHRYTNAAGQAFWTGSPWQQATPSSALGPAWSSVDWVMTEALRLGMTISLSIFYSWGTTGAAPDIIGASLTHMYNVGYAVATRYAAYPNIAWHVMFDTSDTVGTPGGQRIDSYFHGINDGDGSTQRLRWVEGNNPGSTFAQLGGFTYANWSANGFYSYAGNSTELIEASYNEVGATTIPTGDVEPKYDGNGVNGQILRYRSWAVFLEGGMYENYGHEGWWKFGETSGPVGDDEGLDWQDVPAHVHTVQQSYIWPFIDQFVATPDWAPTNDWVTAGQGTSGDKAAIGRGVNDAVAYFPSNTGRATVTIDTTVLAGTGNVRIRWFDPYTGAYTTVSGTEAPSSGRSVTYPAAHADSSSDWVLLVENLDRPVVVDNATHLHVASIPALTLGAGPVVVDSATHLNVASIPALTMQPSTLTVSNAAHLQLVDDINVFSIGTISVASAIHLHTVISIVFEGGGIPGVFLGDQQITSLFLGDQQIPSGYVGDDPL